MKNLNVLRDRVFETNKANGWHEGKRSYGELIALVHSEVSEALEDFRNGKEVNEVWYEYKGFGSEFANNSALWHDGSLILGKPCGIPSELADIVIRILDICGLYGWDIESEYTDKVYVKIHNFNFCEQLALIHYELSNSFFNVYHEHPTKDILNNFDSVINEIEIICKENNIDLEAIIEQKLQYNATRGYKHGGKVI